MIRKKHITAPKVIMPGHLSGPYWLLGDRGDLDIEEIAGLISYASPGSLYLGCGMVPPSEGAVILHRSDALLQTKKLVEQEVKPERIHFMPLTTEYPWAPWSIWKNFEDRPDLRNNLTSREALIHNTPRSWPMAGDWRGHWAATYLPSLKEHEALFDIVLRGLADDKSKQIFSMVLRSDPMELWDHFVNAIFNTCDYLGRTTPSAGDCILNLGVFSGPELPYFMTLVGENGVVHNIDPLGHDKFDDYVRDFVATCPHRAREARIAAGQRREQLSFHVGSDGQIRSGGDITLLSIPLDEYVEQQGMKSVDFIKIDIEGMEIEALFGMSSAIKKYRPTLAVSIYHSPEHMWRIPLMLMQGLSEYDFYIDHFSPMFTETILTAIPKELRGIAHGLNRAPDHLSITSELFYPLLADQSSAQVP